MVSCFIMKAKVLVRVSTVVVGRTLTLACGRGGAHIFGLCGTFSSEVCWPSGVVVGSRLGISRSPRRVEINVLFSTLARAIGALRTPTLSL